MKTYIDFRMEICSVFLVYLCMLFDIPMLYNEVLRIGLD